jgi:membrane fusion protein, multidrug efflux system
MHGVVGIIAQGSGARRRSLRQIAKRLGLIAAVLGFLTAGAWYGYTWWTLGRFMETTDDAYVGGEVTTIASKVAGFIDIIAVTDNQEIKAGDLLVKLDDRDYRAQLARAEANVVAQEAAIANREAARRLQTAMVEQASAEIAATTAEVARSQYDLDRYRTLSADRFVSIQRFEQADADYKKAVAVERKAQAALQAAQRQLDVIDSEKRQIEAALAQAKAERDLASLNLGYTEIRSPIDGVIGNRSARAGAYATIGAQLLSIVPAHGLWVDAKFQGEPARADVGRTAGGDHRRRAAGQALPRADREPRAGHRGPVQRDPTRECDRQFHQDRATRAGADRLGRRRRRTRHVATRPVGLRARRSAPPCRCP